MFSTDVHFDQDRVGLAPGRHVWPRRWPRHLWSCDHPPIAKDAAAIDAARRDAQDREADAILIEMNVVLNKMLELESFKEAVDLLRSIIAMQKEIGDKTDAQRQSKARLLGDD
ncbi:MAG: hypothetical protein QM775_17580 [Pirellulales bacterium]